MVEDNIRSVRSQLLSDWAGTKLAEKFIIVETEDILARISPQ